MLYQKTNDKAFQNLYFDTLPRFGIKFKPFDAPQKTLTKLIEFVENNGVDYRRVLIVGSNPSVKSMDDSAFAQGTKSRATIESWFDDRDYLITYKNIVNFKTEGNRALKKSEISKHLPQIINKIAPMEALGWKIVAVGNTAQQALDLAEVEHYKMWHPSGLCRKWNDKAAGEAKIQDMLRWIHEMKN